QTVKTAIARPRFEANGSKRLGSPTGQIVGGDWSRTGAAALGTGGALAAFSRNSTTFGLSQSFDPTSAATICPLGEMMKVAGMPSVRNTGGRDWECSTVMGQ